MRVAHLALLALTVACSGAPPRTEEAQAATPSVPTFSDSARMAVRLQAVSLLRPRLDSLTQAALEGISPQSTTHALNLSTLRIAYSGDPDRYDATFKGSRITQADGFSEIDDEWRSAKKRIGEACESGATPLPDTIAKLSRYVQPSRRDICTSFFQTIDGNAGKRLDVIFAKKRGSEASKIYTYLKGQIGSLSGPLSAERDRGVLYLGRLAQRVSSGDGPIYSNVQSLAQRAQAWRDAQIERLNITYDMKQELRARGELAALEATHRRNQAEFNRLPQATRDSLRADAKSAACGAFDMKSDPRCQ